MFIGEKNFGQRRTSTCLEDNSFPESVPSHFFLPHLLWSLLPSALPSPLPSPLLSSIPSSVPSFVTTREKALVICRHHLPTQAICIQAVPGAQQQCWIYLSTNIFASGVLLYTTACYIPPLWYPGTCMYYMHVSKRTDCLGLLSMT